MLIHPLCVVWHWHAAATCGCGLGLNTYGLVTITPSLFHHDVGHVHMLCFYIAYYLTNATTSTN